MDRPHVTREEVADKLAAMQLHDDTGDPRDEGYMAAVNEFRAWLEAMAQERGTSEPSPAGTLAAEPPLNPKENER